MSPIRLVTFDVTNTIIRVLGSVGQNYAKIAAIYNTQSDPVKLEAEFKLSFKFHTDKYPNFGTKDGLTPSKWWTNVVVESFTKSGCDVSNIDQISRHLYLYFSTKQGWEVIPDTEKTLMKLKQLGFKVGVISNFDERLDKILRELALRHYFDFVLPSAVVKVVKPEVGIFQMALDSAEVRAEEALHVGDHVVNDYHGARKAGMTSLLLLNKDKPVPDGVNKEHVIAQINDVLEYLK